MGLLDLSFFLLQSIFQLEQLISYKLDEATMNLLQVRLFNVALDKLIGSLSNADGNGNENCKKEIGLIYLAKQKLCMCITVFCTFLPNYNMKVPNFTFWRRHEHMS